MCGLFPRPTVNIPGQVFPLRCWLTWTSPAVRPQDSASTYGAMIFFYALSDALFLGLLLLVGACFQAMGVTLSSVLTHAICL